MLSRVLSCCGGRGVKFLKRSGVPSPGSLGALMFSGVLGGVTRSSSRRSGVTGRAPDSDGAEDIVPDAVVLSPLTLSTSSPLVSLFLRLTTRCFRFRPPWGFPCLAEPKPKPEGADPKDVSPGLDGCGPASRFSENTYVVLELPVYEWPRAMTGVIGVARPLLPCTSPLSVGPAQALKTTSRIPGVKSDKVLCESVRALRRRRFFCEKRACISGPESRSREAIWEASKTLPELSTGS